MILFADLLTSVSERRRRWMPGGAKDDRSAEALAEGMQLLFDGLIAELGPRMEELRGLLGELNAYHPPEVLENGDILIRRKTPEEIEAEENGEGMER